MIKNLKGWEMHNKSKIANIYVRHFAGDKLDV